MSMNFSSSKQFVKPPQRGIFPLDHDSECKPQMKVRLHSQIHSSIHDRFRRRTKIYWMIRASSIYFRNHTFYELSIRTDFFLFFIELFFQIYLECLKDSKQQHHKCRDFSKDYLQCRMDNELMAKEDLNKVSLANADSNIQRICVQFF